MKAIVPIHGTIQIIPNESTFHTVFQVTPNLVLEKLIVISDQKYWYLWKKSPGTDRKLNRNYYKARQFLITQMSPYLLLGHLILLLHNYPNKKINQVIIMSC